VSSSTNKLEVRLQCTEKEVKANFVLQLEALNSEHVKGSVHGTASGNDHTMNTDSAFTARWIGGACGDVH
jgi:hypothetical protein